MSEPEVSVIIPAKNATDTLADCLLALRAQTYHRERFEVIVVDDGSTDKTAGIAEKYSARECRTRVLRLGPPSAGPAVARNRAVEVARGKILVFTDADCAPEPTFLEEMLEPFRDERVVASKGIYRSDQKSLTARFVQAEYESRYRLMERCETIDFVDTYAAAYRRDAFESVGGFDESFPLPSVEDQELSFRLAAQGARMIFCPAAVVTHRHAADPIGYLRKKAKIGFWKMRVLARFPDKAKKDSHTPSTLKLQIVLAALTLLVFPLVFVEACWWIPLAVFTVFAATTIPFAACAARRDLIVGFIAPWMIFGRSLALGTGMSLGILRGQFVKTEEVSTLRRREDTTAPPDLGEVGRESESGERVVQHA